MAKSKKKSDGKQRVELRIDPALYRLVEDVACEAGISINQLVQGVLWWAMPRAIAYGSADAKDDGGSTVFFAGCEDPDGKVVNDDFHPADGEYWFKLDFSERRAVVPGNAKGGRHGQGK